MLFEAYCHLTFSTRIEFEFVSMVPHWRSYK